jgi:hypothetical protein
VVLSRALPRFLPADGPTPAAGSDRPLGLLLVAQGALVAAGAVVGPLVLDVLHYRTSESGLHQVAGTDLVGLVLVAPMSMGVARLAWQGHPAAPVLAMAPALATGYIWTQLLLGNEWGALPGNVERFAPMLLSGVVVAGAVVVRAVHQLHGSALPIWTPVQDQGTGVLLLVVAGFVAVGIHLRSLLDALGDPAADSPARETPVAFWLVKAMDLGAVVPAAVVLGVGLLQHRGWARTPAAALLGGYAVLGASVAAMGVAMLRGSDPDASVPLTVGMGALAAGMAGYAGALVRPLFGGRR